jgi:hypothetical protein
MCHKMNLLDGNGHDAPPVVTSPTASSPHTVSGESLALIPDKNRVVYPGPLNVGSSADVGQYIFTLVVADIVTAIAKLCEREIQSAPVESEVGPDPKYKIGRQGNDPVQNAQVVRCLDGGGEVAREEQAIVRIIVQNPPFEVFEGGYAL